MRTKSFAEEPRTARYSEDLDELLAQVAVYETAAAPTEEQIARRANQIWRLNGCPEGTADTDWFEAAEQLREFYR